MSIMPSCREVQTQLTEYLDGSLPLQRRLGIWIHLRFCRVCAGFLRGLKALPVLGKASLAPPPAPPEGAEQVLARVRATLKGKG